jgi:hypothetical protein
MYKLFQKAITSWKVRTWLKFIKSSTRPCRCYKAKGIYQYEGTDWSVPSHRIGRYIDWSIIMRDNIDFGANIAQEVIIFLIVENGFPGRRR